MAERPHTEIETAITAITGRQCPPASEIRFKRIIDDRERGEPPYAVEIRAYDEYGHAIRNSLNAAANAALDELNMKISNPPDSVEKPVQTLSDIGL